MSSMRNKRHNSRIQMTQPTSGGAITALTNCCAKCDETSRPQQWSPDLPAGWASAVLIKAGDVETNLGPTTTHKHKRVWICNICYKQTHVRKQISIRCNRIEHWVHLRCAGIRQAQYTYTWACHLHTEYRLTQT